MTEDFPVEAEAPEVPAQSNGSARDRLRARHRALQLEHHKDIDIPGYGGDLVGRYVVMDPDDVKKGNRKIERLPKDEQLLIAAIDQIIAACDSLWVRQENGELEPLVPEDPDPIRFEAPRLADFFGFPASTAREVVRQVFTVNGKLNAAAVISHSQEIGIWMQDVSPEVEDAFTGE